MTMNRHVGTCWSAHYSNRSVNSKKRDPAARKNFAARPFFQTKMPSSFFYKQGSGSNFFNAPLKILHPFLLAYKNFTFFVSVYNPQATKNVDTKCWALHQIVKRKNINSNNLNFTQA